MGGGGRCYFYRCRYALIHHLCYLSDEDDKDEGVSVNQCYFASESTGAVILEDSKGSKGYHNLLSDDRDKYGIAPYKKEMTCDRTFRRDTRSWITTRSTHRYLTSRWQD